MPLDACNCRFDGLESAVYGGSNLTEFERLNNAIVKAGESWGGDFLKLSNDWQDRVVEERSWKIAIPPLWSSLLEEFWVRYAKLYRAKRVQGNPVQNLTNPYDVAPSGIPGALRELWAPAADTAKSTSEAAAAALTELQNATAAKTEQLLQAAGRQIGKGASEAFEKKTGNWGVILTGLGAVGVAGYYLMRPRRA